MIEELGIAKCNAQNSNRQSFCVIIFDCVIVVFFLQQNNRKIFYEVSLK